MQNRASKSLPVSHTVACSVVTMLFFPVLVLTATACVSVACKISVWRCGEAAETAEREKYPRCNLSPRHRPLASRAEHAKSLSYHSELVQPGLVATASESDTLQYSVVMLLAGRSSPPSLRWHDAPSGYRMCGLPAAWCGIQKRRRSLISPKGICSCLCVSRLP